MHIVNEIFLSGVMGIFCSFLCLVFETSED